MSAKINNIAKNTSYFTLGLILQKIISFTYFTLLARALGPEDLGKYYFAISFTTIFAIFIDLGLANVLIREVAKAQDRAEEILGNVMAIKIPLAILSLLVVVLVINILGYPELTRDLVYLSAISMVLDSFALTFFSVSRGFHNLLYESLASVWFQIIVLVFGLSILYSGFGLRWQMVALSLASVFNFSYSAFILLRKWKIKIHPVFNKEMIVKIATIAVPFAVFGVFQRLYMYLDSVFLSLLTGDKQVGLYQVAFKIVFALQFLPAAFIASLYPAMSAYWASNREQLVVAFERAMNYLIIISLPIAIGTIVLADKIVLIFKSGYSEAVLPLQLVIASIPFLFLNFPIGSLLNACDRQKANTWNMGIVTAVSVIMNLILIPKWQAVGASFTVLITNILMFVLGMIIVPRIIEYKIKKNLLVLLKSFTAGLVMSFFVWYLKTTVNIFAVVTIGGVVYFVLLFVLGAFKKEDVISILQSFKRKTA